MSHHPTPRSPGRAPWAAAAAAILGVVSAGCQFGTLNGTTVSGSNTGRTLYFAGYANAPSQTMTVYVLDDPTDDPYDSSATWASLGTTVSSATATYDSAGNAWYAYYVYVTPVPSSGYSYRWPSGGLVRLKTTQGSSNVYSFDEDFWDCAFEDTSDYYDVGSRCYSPTSPVTTVVDIDPISSSSADYLSFRATSGEAASYYAQVLAAPANTRYTFSGWKSANGFPSGSETIAYYFNDGDLGFGRQMHCKATSYNSGYACYVTNFNESSESATIANTISSTNPQATVAMEYWPLASHDKVRFFVYDAAGARLDALALDSEGDKEVPGLCLSCHGGTYDTGTHRVTDARFLPFDIYSFHYSTTAGYTRADQEEAFRKLNKIVNSTGPTPVIADLIDGWYGGNVAVAGTTFDDTYVPAGWTTSSKAEKVYDAVMEDYCRTCHAALETDKDFDTYAELEAAAATVESYVCDGHYMPHAERTREHFWESPARAHLVNALRLTNDCN